MEKKARFMLAGTAVVAAGALVAPTAAPTLAVAGGPDNDDQRSDRPTWKAGHDDDAITVLASGQWFQGRDTIAAVLHRHFEDREATWTWTELSRAVDGCKTGTILYDATYAIPSAGFTQRAYVSVVYTRKHGKWLSVIDQSTLVKPS
jgi:hypothetical protein